MLCRVFVMMVGWNAASIWERSCQTRLMSEHAHLPCRKSVDVWPVAAVRHARGPRRDQDPIGLLSSLSLLRLLGLVGSLSRSAGVENLLVGLLSRDEGVLEEVGVWGQIVSIKGKYGRFSNNRNALSELAKRIARVTASASPSLTSAAAFQTQERSEPTLGESFISGTM